MQPGVLIRLRPLGAWRFGPADGGHDQVDTLYRSDRLYSAVTLSMQRLGWLDEWLEATAQAARPAVVFSSLFPFQGDTLYAIPPTTLWPPPPPLLTTPSPGFLTKIRWKSARFVPLSVIDSLIAGQPILADQWLPDPESGCLLRRDRPSSSPFRVVVRSTAAVDRLRHTSGETQSLACVEFEQSAGLWTLGRFADSAAEQTWGGRLQAALRLLSDSGFGGGRSRGWGQTQPAEFQTGSWPGILLPKLGRLLRNTPQTPLENGGSALYWLLSLYSPAAADKVDWGGGNYSLTTRAGRVESNSGHGAPKKAVRMVTEGCVLAAGDEPVGTAADVAPDGFAHPVYRSGLALALRLPVVEAQQQPVEEEPSIEEPVTEEITGTIEHPSEEPAAETSESHAEAAVAEPVEPASADETPSVEEHTESVVETTEHLVEEPLAEKAEPLANEPAEELPKPVEEEPSKDAVTEEITETNEPHAEAAVTEPVEPASPDEIPSVEEHTESVAETTEHLVEEPLAEKAEPLANEPAKDLPIAPPVGAPNEEPPHEV